MKVATIPLLFAVAAGAPARANENIDLGWLAGHWCSQSDKSSSEEHWLPARGGLMLGLGRTVSKNKNKTEFEFLRIEITGMQARYIAQPGGAPPTAFELIDAGANHATFANPQHDFPKRIRYQRTGDTLTARVDDGTAKGAALEFNWRPCQPMTDVK